MDVSDSLFPPAPRGRVARRAKVWWALRALLGWGSATVVVAAIALGWPATRPWLLLPLVALGVVTALMVLIAPVWRYRVHRWEVGERATYARSGWLVQEWRAAPTSRIQTVDAVRGPLEQALGLATLRVTTASSSGAVVISGLAHGDAERAAARLAEIAEVSEGDAT